MSHAIQFYSYNHGELNFSHPRFSHEDIKRGLQVENKHQNDPYYLYPIITSHLQHNHHNMPPYRYPIMQPQPICLCPYFTSTPTYALYIVTH